MKFLAQITIFFAVLVNGSAVVAQAQPVRDSSPLSPSRPLTKQEIADACNHTPGARLRLYGCTPQQAGMVRPAPVYVVGGVVHEMDTATRTLSQLCAWLGVDSASVVSVRVVRPDSAVARYGLKARGGAILIVITSDSSAKTPPATP